MSLSTLQKTIAVLFGVLLCFTFGSVYAADLPKGVEYKQIVGQIIPANPVVCIVEFNDESIDDIVVKRIIDNVKNAILDWESQLKNSESHPKYWNKWDLSIKPVPVDEKEIYDYSRCDVVINFEGQPTEDVTYFTALGYMKPNTTPTEIVLFYRQIQVISSSDTYYEYWNFVYSDEPRLPNQIGNVARHEFGHAMGLGHYQYTYAQGNSYLVTLGQNAPSIMVPISPDVIGEQWIKTIDVKAVKLIYGEDGFLSNPREEIVVDVVLEPEIPDWVKNNAAWWGDGMVSDGEFILAIKYLIEQSIIDISITESISSKTTEIPDWIRSNATWWADGTIDDDTFVSGIQYLIKNGIITL